MQIGKMIGKDDVKYSSKLLYIKHKTVIANRQNDH